MTRRTETFPSYAIKKDAHTDMRCSRFEKLLFRARNWYHWNEGSLSFPTVYGNLYFSVPWVLVPILIVYLKYAINNISWEKLGDFKRNVAYIGNSLLNPITKPALLDIAQLESVGILCCFPHLQLSKQFIILVYPILLARWQSGTLLGI